MRKREKRFHKAAWLMTYCALLLAGLLSGCSAASTAMPEDAEPFGSVPPEAVHATQAPVAEAVQKMDLADGLYSVEFSTDSSMFRVNETQNGMGVLTVKDGVATVHVTLASQKILNLFPGTAEEAKKDGAEWLQPTVDSVTYDDGAIEEVYGFDIPVPAINEEFPVALIGTKGVWYDHMVKVENPVQAG